MPNACTSSNASNRAVFCSTDENNILTPAVRILLASYYPKYISQIVHDYPAIPCETAAVLMMKDEDSGTKIRLVQKKPVNKPANCIELSSDTKGTDLLGPKVNLSAGTLQLTGPNVDITSRQAPAQKGTHEGVHTVHRLYMAAAFRLLLGGNDVGNNTGVAAFVVSPSGQILCWGKKSPAHPMLHAETSALLAYGTSLPKGARIYSTLMPCQMCRAFLERFSTGGDFVVYYGQYDPTHKASGSKDVNKYVLLSNPSTKNPEKPIWDPDSDKRRGELRDTVTSRLNRRYEDVHAKKRDLGIIDFIKGDDKTAAAQLRNAANYLQVKQQKYTDAKLAAIYNQNVKKCLEHITTVLQDLGLPGPVKL